jgi:excisionase family DNA binding protein
MTPRHTLPRMVTFDTEYVSRAQAAELLGITTRTLSRYVRQGTITAYRIPGGQLRFRRVEVLGLIRAVDEEPAAS